MKTGYETSKALLLVAADAGDLTPSTNPRKFGAWKYISLQNRKHGFRKLPTTVAQTRRSLYKDAALRLLEEDARFRSSVQKGLAAACGDFIEEGEMDARIAKMLPS